MKGSHETLGHESKGRPISKAACFCTAVWAPRCSHGIGGEVSFTRFVGLPGDFDQVREGWEFGYGA